MHRSRLENSGAGSQRLSDHKFFQATNHSIFQASYHPTGGLFGLEALAISLLLRNMEMLFVEATSLLPVWVKSRSERNSNLNVAFF